MPIPLSQIVRDEVTSLLQKLIQINTTNPPGNETAAAQLLSSELSSEGFECEIIESKPSRGNVITKLKGTGEKPSLLLLSHLDVVAANPNEWTVDPFSGEVKDGFVWGRGALDMKSMTAIEVMTMKLLKRNNIKLKGDVLLAATADEEKGGFDGAGYLLANYKDKIYADYVLNEGGGTAVPTQNGNVFTVNAAEKGILWFKIKAKGTPGHGSTPNVADNAVLCINRIINKLASYTPEVRFIPTVKGYLEEIAKKNPALQKPFSEMQANPEHSEQILDALARQGEPLAEEIRPRIKMTLTPTMISGGVKENIVPSTCQAVFDCRLLPGQKVEEALALIKSLLSDVGLEKLSFEFIQAHEGSQSPMQTPLYDAIFSVLREFEPDCSVSPTLMTGGTDSHFFREAGSVCYGFHPMHPEPPVNGRFIKREHGVDERISVDNLVFGTSVMFETVKKFMA
jgi:acetylornithine deacetylase/succinyl-diaminopimelate desuccinylase-like protein